MTQKFLVIGFDSLIDEPIYDFILADDEDEAAEKIQRVRGEHVVVVDVFTQNGFEDFVMDFAKMTTSDVIRDMQKRLVIETCGFCGAHIRVDNDGGLHCECTDEADADNPLAVQSHLGLFEDLQNGLLWE